MSRTHHTARILSRRHGSMFVETAIGISLAIVVMIAVAQFVAVIAYQRHSIAESRLATRELANAMEHVIAVPWNELNVDEPPSVALSAPAEERLAEPRLSVLIGEEEGDPGVKRLVVQIDWLNRVGQRVDPLQLVAWKHEPPSPTADTP